jgi:hypothetical protein
MLIHAANVKVIMKKRKIRRREMEENKTIQLFEPELKEIKIVYSIETLR